MEDRLLVIKPLNNAVNPRLEDMLSYALKGHDYCVATDITGIKSSLDTCKYVLWAVDLGSFGINIELYRMLEWIRENKTCFRGHVGGIIIDGESELFTKDIGRQVVFYSNESGMNFPGRCLVEGPANLRNYIIQARNFGTDRIGAYREACRNLIAEMKNYDEVHIKKRNPKLLILHASDSKTSNTLRLWDMVKEKLDGLDFREISLRNGEIMDCRGCSYEVCRYFSEAGRCFYGGTITDLVYPGVLECDAIVMLCPNYNDAMSANMTAFVNRMTALFVSNRFYDKNIYGIIVSGYSGGDIIAEQLISGLNMNKTFALPGNFALIETANEPGSIENIDGLQERIEEFASNIRRDLME